MLLTDKAETILMIVLEVLFTLGLIAASICIAVLVPDVAIKIVYLAFLLLVIAFTGVMIGLTAFFYIDEL